MSSSRLLIISNRLPVSIQTLPKEGIRLKKSSGGLVSAISGLQDQKYLWVGWVGAEVPLKFRVDLEEQLTEIDCHPVYLNKNEIDSFYNGACNSIIWPNFHYLLGSVRYKTSSWDSYVEINQRFANEILKVYQPGDLIWIHDYHLMLLPAMLKEVLPDSKIGFFLHIPFPSSEIFKTLPMRKQILAGLMGCDLIGFQAYSHQRHFVSSCLRVLGADAKKIGSLHYKGREILIDIFPVGIDFQKFDDSVKDKEVQKRLSELKQTFQGKKVVVGVDRVDYIKGISFKLRAFEVFLKRNPKWRNKITLIQVGIPSREDIEMFRVVKSEVNQLVSEINGRYGTADHTPIQYINRSIDYVELAALYRLADIHLNTSIRDGMNLVCQEYIACQKGQAGSVILSEFAGAAQNLTTAHIVNPWDISGVADTLRDALNTPIGVRKQHLQMMYEFVKNHSSTHWGQRYLQALSKTQVQVVHKPFDAVLQNQMMQQYQSASRRFFFLDYDGTLVGYHSVPEKAVPSKQILNILKKLIEQPGTQVFLVSGRDRRTLEKWFQGLNIGICAEHGFAYRFPGRQDWQVPPHNYVAEYSEKILKILKNYCENTPHSFVEEKHSSITWHYRMSDPEIGSIQALELASHLRETLTNLPVEVLEGNKVIEVRNAGISKGSFIEKMQSSHTFDEAFVFCAGDDQTDEDMFHVLQEQEWVFKVGQGSTEARYFLNSHQEVHRLLKLLSEKTWIEKSVTTAG